MYGEYKLFLFIMGAALGAAAGAIAGFFTELGAAIAAGASTVAAAAASAAASAGLVAVSTVEIIELSAAASSFVLDGVWVTGVATYSLTTLGEVVLGATLAAAAGATIGISVAATGGLTVEQKSEQSPSVLEYIEQRPPLVCALDPDNNECRRRNTGMYTGASKSVVRIRDRKSVQRTMLSYASPSRVDRKRRNNANQKSKTAKSRKISKSFRSVRKQNR